MKNILKLCILITGLMVGIPATASAHAAPVLNVCPVYTTSCQVGYDVETSTPDPYCTNAKEMTNGGVYAADWVDDSLTISVEQDTITCLNNNGRGPVYVGVLGGGHNFTGTYIELELFYPYQDYGNKYYGGSGDGDAPANDDALDPLSACIGGSGSGCVNDGSYPCPGVGGDGSDYYSGFVLQHNFSWLYDGTPPYHTISDGWTTSGQNAHIWGQAIGCIPPTLSEPEGYY